MTRSIRGARRGAVLLAGAATTGLLMSGCGAGQIAETANIRPAVPGVNVETTDGLFKVRNAIVEYSDPLGYPSGGDAPLSMALYNDSAQPITVTVTTDSAEAVVLVDTTATPAATPSPTTAASPDASPDPTGEPPATPTVEPSPGASGRPDPSASPGVPATPDPTVPATPAPPAGAPAQVEIPALGYLLLNDETGRILQLVGLDTALAPGRSVNLTFEVNGERLETPVPVAVPQSPAPRGSLPVGDEGHGG
ncbi:hypothetical protein O7627_02065 [Solwaraspora sp. WMMD1047]|uniref:hypothetical protein n=1 Tax=Solwaraspora sp. WMMD1047 TaxID=3016102 RepID=UPI0024164114|nr:hypothetical protein [Solwaraspora sp. WMMD1047]MDG4828088.1 hypothetical protein [Solwaraspora sp. WMMD1047]